MFRRRAVMLGWRSVKHGWSHRDVRFAQADALLVAL
jgi:hypothetical protein